MVFLRKNRLKTREIKEVFKRGRKYKGEFLNLKLVKNNLPLSRFAFIVPLTLSKKSTERNKFQRRAQDLLRKKIETLKTGFDGVFVALPGALERDSNEMDREIEKLLRVSRLKLFK